MRVGDHVPVTAAMARRFSQVVRLVDLVEIEPATLFHASAWTKLEPVTDSWLVGYCRPSPKRDSSASKSDNVPESRALAFVSEKSALALNGDAAYKMNWSGCAAPWSTRLPMTWRWFPSRNATNRNFPCGKNLRLSFRLNPLNYGFAVA
jgi:hypothetical protein